MAKTETLVDKKKLKQAIANAEADGPLKTLGKLFQQVAVEYEKLDKKISPSVVTLRIKQWGLTHKTTPGKRGGHSKGRTAVEVNRGKLEDAVKQAEANGPLDSLSALYEAVAENYNKMDERSIGFAIAKLRIEKWEIPIKTTAGKRGNAAKVKVNKEKFAQAVIDCENKEEFSNLSALHQAVANEYNAKTGEEISPAIVGLRIQKWELPIKTTKGKKGRQKDVDKDQLIAALQKCEDKMVYKSRSLLFDDAAREYTYATGQEISGQTVHSRVENWKIELKTKGRERGENHVAVKRDAFEKPTVADVYDSRHYRSCGCGFPMISAPAGNPPVALKSTDYESVKKWAEDIVEAGHKAQIHYTISAVKYFLQRFYRWGTPEFEECSEHIMACMCPMEDTLEEEEQENALLSA
jgi:hypothetical protein